MQKSDSLQRAPAKLFLASPARILEAFSSSTLARNTAYSLLEMGLPFVLMLAATPFLLFRMGTETYGLWNVALAFMGLLGVLDLGMGTAVTKFIAEYYEHHDIEKISTTATMAILLNAVIGLVFTALSYWLAPLLSQLFSSAEIMAANIEIVFRLAALGLFPMLFQNVCLAIPRGLQDYKTPTLALLGQNIATLLLAMLITFLGGSIIHVVAGALAITWIFAVISLKVAWDKLRGLHISMAFSSETMRTLLQYMFFMGLTGIGIKVFTLFDRIVVAQVLGFSAAAYYTIATGIANKFSALASAATQSLLPAFSSWNVKDEKQLIWKKLVQATSMMGLVFLLAGGLFLLFSRPLLTAWLGQSGGVLVLYPTRILVFIYMVKTLTAPSFQAANGMGAPWITAFTTLVASFGTIGLILLWGTRYSLTGAAWANIASWALFGILFYLSRRLRSDKLSNA